MKGLISMVWYGKDCAECIWRIMKGLISMVWYGKDCAECIWRIMKGPISMVWYGIRLCRMHMENNERPHQYGMVWYGMV